MLSKSRTYSGWCRTREASGQLPGAGTAPAEASLTERMRRWWGQGPQIGARFEALKDEANRAVEQVVRLIVVFTLQTLVLPLLLGWALWRAAKALLGAR